MTLKLRNSAFYLFVALGAVSSATVSAVAPNSCSFLTPAAVSGAIGQPVTGGTQSIVNDPSSSKSICMYPGASAAAASSTAAAAAGDAASGQRPTAERPARDATPGIAPGATAPSRALYALIVLLGAVPNTRTHVLDSCLSTDQLS